MTTKYVNIKIPVMLAGKIDDLIKSEVFASRAAYIKALIRADLKFRGLLGV